MKRGAHTRGRRRFGLHRDRLPSPSAYFDSIELTLLGHGEWRSALCPFHADASPSLRVNLSRGCWRCMACGAHGGDVLDFHRRLRGLGFIEAARDLGAWEGLP